MVGGDLGRQTVRPPRQEESPRRVAAAGPVGGAGRCWGDGGAGSFPRLPQATSVDPPRDQLLGEPAATTRAGAAGLGADGKLRTQGRLPGGRLSAGLPRSGFVYLLWEVTPIPVTQAWETVEPTSDASYHLV